MIYHLSGKLSNKEKNFIVIDINGIGYQVNIPINIEERLPQIGKELKIFTYQVIKEDSNALYGFLTKDERRLFAMLITVSGVGPKAALSVMSGLAIETITSAIVKGNAEILSSAPGVGKKTAQKICIELKEKLAKSLGVKPSEMQQALPEEKGMVNDAIQALMTLGYTPKEARDAIFNSGIDFDQAKNVEQIIKASLKALV
ncbi:MAG: Holliday junction branch migration protein RuvA [Candidatus Saganbacteria bacterium]|nr:Holliday junction branch migration protein RuvA [Candidatus Saganbacteria bacterium]